MYNQAMISISLEDSRSPAAAQLIASLSSELASRYGDDGSGSFDPEDVRVPGGAFVIARLDGRPVGCGALRPFGEPGVGEIKRMFVCAEARGQHIGQLILEKLEALARVSRYQTLKLETGTLQPEAIRLYERMGYQRIPRYGEYADSPMSVCFEKRLSGS